MNLETVIRSRFAAALSLSISALPIMASCEPGERIIRPDDKSEASQGDGDGDDDNNVDPRDEWEANGWNVSCIEPEPTPFPLTDDNGCLLSKENSCCNLAVAGPEWLDDLCCYAWEEDDGCCGRPLLDGGQGHVAPQCNGTAWSRSPHATVHEHELARLADALGADDRQRIGHAWLRAARLEHASIASFTRFVNELLRFAAPPELISDALTAARDEVDHAGLCYRVANVLLQRDHEPAPWSTPDLGGATDLEQAVWSAFIEGCVGETQAAAQLLLAASRCEQAEIARVVSGIGEDELRHAELAWRFVQWGLERLDVAARDRLAARGARFFGEAATMDRETVSANVESRAQPDPERTWGQLTPDVRRQSQARCMQLVIAPCWHALIEQV